MKTREMSTQEQCQPIVESRLQRIQLSKMNRSTIKSVVTIIILVSLPYISTLNLPSGDPAPGRSPGPPFLTEHNIDVEENLESNLEVPVDEVYDEVTTNEVTTTLSETSVSDRIMSDACAFAKIPSDSDEIVTLSEKDSDINLTVSHSVFETNELVRGVVYDGKFLI